MGFARAATGGWAAPLTVTLLAAGAALLAAFVAAEARVAHPLLPLRIVADRARGGAYLAFALVMIGMYGMFLLVSFYLQAVAGYSPLAAGAAFLPFAVGNLAGSALTGKVTTRVRPGWLLAAGLLAAAAGMGWLTQLQAHSGYPGHVLPALLLIGAGLGVLAPVAAGLATSGVPDRETAVASAVFNASEQVGASVGTALLNTLAAGATAGWLATRGAASHQMQLAAAVHGYTTATAWAAGILLAGAIAVLILVGLRERVAAR